MMIINRSLLARRVLLCFMPGLALFLISLAVLGCQSSIEVVTPAVTPVLPVVTIVPAPYDLAIIDVDFDPSLDYSQIVSDGGVTLLIAVENQGLASESNVEVTARLLETVAGEQPRELLNETAVIRSLAPREVRVVRFNQVTDLPLRERYELSVELVPVQGERDLRDNARIFDILVHGGQ